jgi:hypothetical protein
MLRPPAVTLFARKRHEPHVARCFNIRGVHSTEHRQELCNAHEIVTGRRAPHPVISHEGLYRLLLGPKGYIVVMRVEDERWAITGARSDPDHVPHVVNVYLLESIDPKQLVKQT